MGAKSKVYKDTLFNNNISFFAYTVLLTLVGAALITTSFVFKLFSPSKAIVVNDRVIPYGAILTIVAAVLLIFAVINLFIFIAKRQKRSFILFDDKVTTKYKKETETEIYFKDFYEVYRFRSITNKGKTPFGVMDCLAYRADKEGAWLVVLPTLKKGFKRNMGHELISRVVGSYVKERVTKDFYSLKNGKVLTFEYLLSDNKNRRDIFDSTLHHLAYKPLKEHSRLENSKIYCKANTHKIILELNALIFSDHKIYFEAADIINTRKVDVDNVDFIDTRDNQIGDIVEIIGAGGEIKLSVNTTCLVNGDLFVNILNKIYDEEIKKPIPEPVSV
ncbi:MAG: hypothetical protein LBV08_02230, partial [Clostridiales bacterium]|nr:hypothetical protein [Clostridiales bacterium]